MYNYRDRDREQIYSMESDHQYVNHNSSSIAVYYSYIFIFIVNYLHGRMYMLDSILTILHCTSSASLQIVQYKYIEWTQSY